MEDHATAAHQMYTRGSVIFDRVRRHLSQLPLIFFTFFTFKKCNFWHYHTTSLKCETLSSRNGVKYLLHHFTVRVHIMQRTIFLRPFCPSVCLSVRLSLCLSICQTTRALW